MRLDRQLRLQLLIFMENRNAIVKELFELRVLLNKSNKQANQKTDLDFNIVNDQFIAFTEIAKWSPFILLSEKRGKTDKWQPAPIPYFFRLRIWISNELNEVQSELKRYMNDPKDINEVLLFHIKQKLRSLLI